MAEPATLPSIEEIERASAFAREPFLPEGEDAASALAPGTPRRRALDAALVELEAGAKVPSPHWRRQWSLLLGLERLLSAGRAAARRRHGALRPPGRRALGHADRAARRSAQERRRPVRSGRRARARRRRAVRSPERRGRRGGRGPRSRAGWETRTTAEAEDVAEAPEDPNAGKRFWFEHATGAGKTVAAVGFVEASRTGGILILTHRRNLVDQFHGELRDRGYAKRIAPRCSGTRTRPTAR